MACLSFEITDGESDTLWQLFEDMDYLSGLQKPNADAFTAYFLPTGRSEYSGVSLKTLSTLLDRVATLTTTYKDGLGKELADQAAAFKKAYAGDRQLQGESKGTVQGDSKAEKKLRKAAVRRLKLNLLEQLKLHIDAPNDVKALYNPKIFTQPVKAATGFGSAA